MPQADAAYSTPEPSSYWTMRAALEAQIEAAIALLDDLDGDADHEGQEAYRDGEMIAADIDLEFYEVAA